MKILLASSNEHKKHEIQMLFPNHQIMIASDFGLSFDCAEDGTTFQENALQKAFALYEKAKHLNMPIMADDSGLIVDALPGLLGVRTARFGSKDGQPNLEAHQRNALLLKMMEGKTNRNACFVCAMVLVQNPYNIYSVVKSTDGRILDSEVGQHGFGYDPVFYCNDAQSPMALLSEEEKNKVSHRGKAAKALLKLIEN